MSAQPKQLAELLAQAAHRDPSERARVAFNLAFDGALAKGLERQTALGEAIRAAHVEDGSPELSYEAYEYWAANLILDRIDYARSVLRTAAAATPAVAAVENFRTALVDAVGLVYRAGFRGLAGSGMQVSELVDEPPEDRDPASGTAVFFEGSPKLASMRTEFKGAVQAFLSVANRIMNASARWIKEQGHHPRGMAGRPARDPAEVRAIDILASLGVRTGKIAEHLTEDLERFYAARQHFGMRASAELPKKENRTSAIRKQRRKTKKPGRAQ